MCRRLLVVFAVCLMSIPASVVAQEKTAAAQEKAAAADDFPALYSQWKGQLARFAQIRGQYQTDASADRKALEAEAQNITTKVREMLEPLTIAGLKRYVAAPNQDPELTDFLIGALNGFMIADDYEIAARIARILIDNQCDKPELDFYGGMAFFMTGDYDAAQKHLQAAKDKMVINDLGMRHLDMIDKYKEMWAEEQALRAAEEKAGDLPKVKLTTSQGDIVVALFENEAPNTTANFISLVESGFYNGLTFHRVIPTFMAQAGDPNGDGSGGPGYTIPDECRQENHRKHFRGSLSMAKTATPDSGGSQFFITFAPTGHLDGKHTVFGRVVEGLRVLAKLQRTEGVPGKPGPPDKILRATVLSKRPHEYRAVKRVNESK
jgi:cyclophilin family peptidyl-prolyl cis-trans isomerase